VEDRFDVKEGDVPGDISTWRTPYDLVRAGPMAEYLDALVPTEFFQSIGIPTLRWSIPSYAFFASPALKGPNKPLEVGAPERYWVADARNGRLVLFAQWKALPFATDVEWMRVTVPKSGRTMEQFRDDAATIDALLRVLVSSFFAGERGEDDKREHLRSLLTHHIPDVLKPQYRALTPDFFDWLES